MHCTGLLLFLGLMGAACSSSIPLCPPECNHTTCHPVQFKHMSNLGKASVAPWTIMASQPVDGRSPKVISEAVCGKCTLRHMISKPIYVQISVFHEIEGVTTCCRCNMNVAVGCTCVKK